MGEISTKANAVRLYQYQATFHTSSVNCIRQIGSCEQALKRGQSAPRRNWYKSLFTNRLLRPVYR